MSQFIEHIACPACGSHDNLGVYLDDEGNYNGYCFGGTCGHYEPDPYHDKPAGYKPVPQQKSPEEIAQNLYDIYNYQIKDLPTRGLSADTLAHFGARVGVSRTDGETPELVYFPYTKDGQVSAYKTRVLDPKRMWTVGSMKEVDPFGWDLAKGSGNQKLIITEGELDAMALYQMIREENSGGQWADIIPAVISIGTGSKGAKKSLMKVSHAAELYFKEIILAFDMDEAGQEAAKEVVKEVFPNAKIAHLPLNDPNQCLLEGRIKGCVKAVLWNSVVPKNTRIVHGSELREAAKKRPEMGLPYPWEQLTKLTRGRRRGETIYFGAGVKMGKSELVNALAKRIIVDDGLPCFIVKPEEPMEGTYQRIVGKAAGRIFHDPDVEFDEEAYDQWEPQVGDKAIILDSYQFVDWDTLKQDIKYAVVTEGVQDVIIDPITALTNQVDVSEANELLTSMTAELASMAKDLNFTAYIFCHLKAPMSGEPHERGGKILSTQFAGSRAMMRSCHYMIGMEGNKDPELSKEERNLRNLVILEDRQFGASGVVPLYWDDKTGLFNEIRR